MLELLRAKAQALADAAAAPVTQLRKRLASLGDLQQRFDIEAARELERLRKRADALEQRVAALEQERRAAL